MATLVSTFREPVRAILGDFDSTVRKYQDSAIDSVIRTMIRMGKLPGYSLSVDELSINPTIASPTDFALLIYHAAYAFVAPAAGEYSYRTRAISERFGASHNFVLELRQVLYEADFADQLRTWTSLSSWLTAITGLPVWASMTELTTNIPVAEVSIGRDGVTVSE